MNNNEAFNLLPLTNGMGLAWLMGDSDEASVAKWQY